MRMWIVLSLLALVSLVVVAASCEGSSGTPTSSAGCTAWCTKIVAACPGGDTQSTCEHSCTTYGPGTVSSAAQACADAATDCDSAQACWPILMSGSGGDTTGGESGDGV